MTQNDYWKKVTKDTTIEWLDRRGFLSTRASNILKRGAIYLGGGKHEYRPINTVGELLEVDECELMMYKNMGRKTLEEIDNFKKKFLEKSNEQNLQSANDLISVSAFKEYLKRVAEKYRERGQQSLARMGKGESDLGGMYAYVFCKERERMCEYEVPSLIDGFLEEDDNGREKINKREAD